MSLPWEVEHRMAPAERAAWEAYHTLPPWCLVEGRWQPNWHSGAWARLGLARQCRWLVEQDGRA